MIEFRALGPAELVGGAGTDTRAVLTRPKLLGVLAYLTAGPERGFQRRDALIGTFWAELDQDRARRAVRQSLYRLRQFLGEGAVVTRGDDEVAVSEAECWTDVGAFYEALRQGDRATALGLYRGDLLEGFYVPDAPAFERWLDERRKALRQLAAAAAWEAAEGEAHLNHTASAGRWTRRARELAPLDERLLRRVVKLLDQLGDRAGALREYQTFAKRLADELEVSPAPETEALAERVRARVDVEHGGAASAGPEERSSPAHEPTPVDPGQPTFDPALVEALADRYRLGQLIGYGGMATVYLAHEFRHERDVAIKVLRPELAAQLGPERFLQETKIAAKLAHPHVVPVYDSGSAADRLYYVMPYIDGEPLRSRLERERQLPLEDALAITRDVGDALAYAHRCGVVHRDIKPENILLSGTQALVADFGIARAVSVASEPRLTGAGTVLGTPQYMSPEQATGSGEVDARSDLYSLACVLYEMLGGTPPFTGTTFDGIARQQIYATPRPIADHRHNVPPGVAAAIERGLAKVPDDRYATVADFLEALEADGVAGPAAWRRLRRSFTRLSPVGAALVGAGLVAAGVLGVLWERPAALDPNRVVVSSLENRTDDTTLTALGSMAADWIARGLQEIDVITVVPTATAIFPGPDLVAVAGSTGLSSARAVGRATNAGTVVAGAFYRRGDSLEFHAQVIDAAEERILRSVAPLVAPLGATRTALDSLRRQVAANVAAALDHRLLSTTPTSRAPTLEAYRAYLEGHRAFYHVVPLRMREVLDAMYRAVALDSTFADPRFFIIMAHANLGELHAADSNAQLLLPFRSEFTPYQQATLDWLVARLRGDLAGALQAQRERGVPFDVGVEAVLANRPHETVEMLSSLTDAPEFYFKWIALAEALHMLGEYDRELSIARHVREAYPDHVMSLQAELRALAALGRLPEVHRTLQDVLLLPSVAGMASGDVMRAIGEEFRVHEHRDASRSTTARAVQWFRSRPAEESATWDAKTRMASALALAEQWDEARSLFEDVAAEVPDNVVARGYLGVLAARAGDRETALRISDEIDGMADQYDFGHDTYWQACIAAQLGELDRAMDLLREAYAQGRPFGVMLHRDVNLEPLHDHPPFMEFLRPRG